jgi:prevent-host-death family protein
MNTISIKEAKNRFTELGRRAEAGETVVITRNGKPSFEIGPHRPKGGLNLEALAKFKRERGIESFFGEIPEDFDDPLPEDFVLKPLP